MFFPEKNDQVIDPDKFIEFIANLGMMLLSTRVPEYMKFGQSLRGCEVPKNKQDGDDILDKLLSQIRVLNVPESMAQTTMDTADQISCLTAQLRAAVQLTQKQTECGVQNLTQQIRALALAQPFFPCSDMDTSTTTSDECSSALSDMWQQRDMDTSTTTSDECLSAVSDMRQQPATMPDSSTRVNY